MALDQFIKFDSIEGESKDAEHISEIELLQWSWNADNTAVAGGKGKPTAGDLIFKHYYDKASPMLAKKLAQATVIPNVTLSSRKAGESLKDFLHVTLQNVLVTKVTISGNPSEELLTEDVTLSYSAIQFAYKPQDSKGALGAEVKFSWNQKTNIIT